MQAAGSPYSLTLLGTCSSEVTPKLGCPAALTEASTFKQPCSKFNLKT